MKSVSFRKIAINLLKALVGLGLLWLVVTRTGFTPGAFVITLKSTRLLWLAASLPGVLIILYIKAFRWHLLLRQKDIQFSPQKSYIAYLTSFFIGLLTPGRFGEIVKIYYVRSLPNAGLFNSFQTVIADRFYDLYFLLAAGLTSYLLIFKEHHPHLVRAALVAFPAALFLLWLLLKAWRPSNPSQGIFGFLHGSLNLLTGPSSLLPWLSTLVAYLTYFLQSWFIARSLQLNIDFLSLSAIMVLTSVVLLLPITWAGMGTREFSLVMLMALYGISSEQALAFSLLQFTSSFLIGGLTGLIFWFYMPIPQAELRKDYEAIQKVLRFREKGKE